MKAFISFKFGALLGKKNRQSKRFKWILKRAFCTYCIKHQTPNKAQQLQMMTASKQVPKEHSNCFERSFDAVFGCWQLCLQSVLVIHGAHS